MRRSNTVPIASLSLIALSVLYMWLISDQPRMADGGLSGDEMLSWEKILVLLIPASIFASMFVAMRRAYLAGSWFWFIVCFMAWPLAYVYALAINRGHEA